MSSPRSTWIRSERVMLGGGTEPLRVNPASLRVEGCRIAEVREESRSELEERHRDAPLVDLGAELVTPAFVNGHTHLPMAAFRGIGGLSSLRGNVIEDLYFRLERDLAADDIRAFARIGAYESLLSGVGCVYDHYYGGLALGEALLDVGLSGVVAPTLQDLAGPGLPGLEAQLAATLELSASRRFADAGVFAALGPHATDTVSAALWARIVELGERHRLPLHFHAAQSLEELERCHARHGCSPIEWLRRLGVLSSSCRLLLVHAMFASRSDLALLDRERHLVGVCPYSQMEFCFPADVRELARAGVPWLVATDCANSNDSMSVQKELRLLSGMTLLEATFSPAYRDFLCGGALQDARRASQRRRESFDAALALRRAEELLASVWSIPGTLHPLAKLGCIAPGHLANVIVWDTDHPVFWPGTDIPRALSMSDTALAMEWMMVSGRFIGERGRFHDSLVADPAYREACQEARRRLLAHLRRIGL